MIFNSLIFVLFFTVVSFVYFFIPHKYRWALLLVASCYFYMYFLPIYIFILGFTIVVDYYAGIFISSSTGKRRKFWLICSLVANIGVLAFFKYYNFLNENLTDMLDIFHYQNPLPYLSILLPVGLSFHTFQAMSYTIEVYRGNYPAEKHFGIYALYVMFYPQLVAGPIERPGNLLPQFRTKHYFDYDRVVSGLRLMLWGFVKKLIIADRLSLYINAVYANVHHHSSKSMWLAAFFFILQIYCDFSSYADIAIGSARVMGFNLMTNFNRPFVARTVQNVWKRWHISLMTWFRDYLYFPLGGNRKGIAITIRNMVIVFAISGLWHGASWTFVIWGLVNGFVLGAEQVLKPYFGFVKKWPFLLRSVLGVVYAGTLFTAMGVFFRSYNIRQAGYMLKSMFTFKRGGLFFGEPHSNFYYCIFAAAFLLIADHIQEYKPGVLILGNKSVYVRYCGYTILITLLLLTGVFNGGQYIYFQF